MPASLKWGLQSKEKPHAWHKTRHRAGNHYERKALFIESLICLEELVVMNERVQLVIFLATLLSLHDIPVEKSVGSIKIHDSILIFTDTNDYYDNAKKYQIFNFQKTSSCRSSQQVSQHAVERSTTTHQSL